MIIKSSRFSWSFLIFQTLRVKLKVIIFSSFLLILTCSFSLAQNQAKILGTGELKNYVSYFNSLDSQDVKNYVSNEETFEWLSKNIPLLSCPDSVIQQTYYFRWWSFRKHLKKTPDGFIFTEFIVPVKHAGRHNALSCALGHHIYEGRWLHDTQYLKEYISYWLYKDDNQPKPKFHQFSSWVDDAVYNFYLVHQDKDFLKQSLPALDSDYVAWEQEKLLSNGMFWQFDVRDGMEESMSGGRKVKNMRPTINSYMYGNAKALAEIANIAGNQDIKSKYEQKASQLKSLIQAQLWSDSSAFFKTRLESGNLAKPREAIGFIPWYFNLPDDNKKYARAWDQLIDTAGFDAKWGLTTGEIREPTFQTRGSGHGCEWDGPVWPFATTQTLKGLSNLLTNYKNQGKMTPEVFYDELYTYAFSHQMDGKPYIGEYQDETSGYWLKGNDPRSRFYNHSGFTDLIINDLIGLKPRQDNTLEINPLITEDKWEWFCLDNVLYHGKYLTIAWDKTGKKFGKNKGFTIMADGKTIFNAKKLKPVKVQL